MACALVTIKKIELDERRPSRPMAERLADCLQIPAEERTLFILAARAQLSPDRLPDAIALTSSRPGSGVELEADHTNLPFPTTRLIGRQVELAELRAHLLNPGMRLLTLTGPGGVGKTRLALQAAAGLINEFVDGVYIIDLAPVSEGGLALQAIISVLGLQEDSRRLLDQALITFLRHKRLLLLLDNCEHLVESCAGLTHRLITTCPEVKILATSRQPLGTPGELIYPVQPLPVSDLQLQPDLAALARNEAVSLFTERAEAIWAGFALSEDNARAVGEICIRLDGLPLAIELAAARVNVLLATQIAARLDDSLRLLTVGSRGLHAHQQTLRATLDWSHALLAPGERVLFRRLAIFKASWSLKAAESICADQELIAVEEVLEMLARLIDTSLVKVELRGEEMRYRMLETLRQYAAEQLAASGEERALILRFISYYQGLVGLAEARYLNQEDVFWFDRLELTLDNIRLALENALVLSPLVGARIVIALYYFWLVRGYNSEALGWIEKYLGVLGDTLEERQAKADLLPRAAYFTNRLKGHKKDLELADQGLALAYALDDPKRIGFALITKSGIVRLMGDTQSALVSLEQALALYRNLEDDWGIARCAFHLGGIYHYDLSDRESANHYYQESLQKFRLINNQLGISRVTNSLGDLAFDEGDLENAIKYYEASLKIFKRLGILTNVAIGFYNLGQVALFIGKTTEARKLIEESILMNTKYGVQDFIMWSYLGIGILERIEGEYLLAREKLNQALLLGRESEYKIYIGPILAELGKVECALGNYTQSAALLAEALREISTTSKYDLYILQALESVINLLIKFQVNGKAAQLLGAVDGYRERQGLRRLPITQAEIEPIRQILQAHLVGGGFATNYEQGRSLTLEETVQQAQDMLSRLKTAPNKN